MRYFAEARGHLGDALLARLKAREGGGRHLSGFHEGTRSRATGSIGGENGVAICEQRIRSGNECAIARFERERCESQGSLARASRCGLDVAGCGGRSMRIHCCSSTTMLSRFTRTRALLELLLADEEPLRGMESLAKSAMPRAISVPSGSRMLLTSMRSNGRSTLVTPDQSRLA